MPPEIHRDPDDLSFLSTCIMKQFVQCEDEYSIQLTDGNFLLINDKITSDLIQKHLMGEIFLATPLFDKTGYSKFTVVDSVNSEGFQKNIYTARMLAVERITTYLETYGNGGRIWLFFEEPLPQKIISDFRTSLFNSGNFKKNRTSNYSLQTILSQLMTPLPLGIDLKTKRRNELIDINLFPLAKSLQEQILMLLKPKLIPTSFLRIFLNPPV